MRHVVYLASLLLLIAAVPAHAQDIHKSEKVVKNFRTCYAFRENPHPYNVTCGINRTECNTSLESHRKTMATQRRNVEFTACAPSIHCFGYNQRAAHACYTSAAACNSNSDALKGSGATACKATTSSGLASW
jgi:hypothetical protein